MTRIQTRQTSSSTDHVTAYARDVVAKRIKAGPIVRDACARHLRDLKDGRERGLRWDIEAANRAIRFFPGVLKLNGGEWEGKPYELLRWQKFVVGSLHGWKGADGWRRFRVAYIETAKGSGKSPLAAGLGLLGLVADNEPRAEIYAAATKKDQAMILFRDAVAMRNQSPKLQEKLETSGTGERVWNLAYLATGSFFRPISADDGQSGPRPHMGLIDEVHEHKNNAVIEMVRAGTKNRRQALIVMITNSGTDKTGPCWGYHEYARRVCSGEAEDDSFFGYVCALDKGEDAFKDESCWPKANPSLEEANLPGYKYIREQMTEARGMPGKEATVRRLCFCEWTGAESPWLSYEVWKEAERSYDWRELRGRRAVAGLDLSSTTDLTGLVLLVEGEHESDPLLMVPFCWLPEIGLAEKAEKDQVPYLKWKEEGFLETTPGRAVSRLAVIRRLSELSQFFDIVACGYDRWRIEDLKQMAEEEGIELPEMIPVGQGFKEMSPAIEQFETMLLNDEVLQPGHPVLNWCMGNAVIVSDDAKNRKLSKERSTGRIDLSVAAVMAASLVNDGEEDLSEFLEDPIIV